MEVVPLSQYFVWSEKNNSKEFTTVDWLSRVDDKIIDRIIASSEKFFELGASTESEDPVEENEEINFQCLDYLTLCYTIGEKESDSDSSNFDEQTKHSCLIGLATFAQCERMRRSGILSFTGLGKICEFHTNSTDIELTSIGKKLGSSMKTMMEISDAAEKSP